MGYHATDIRLSGCKSALDAVASDGSVSARVARVSASGGRL